jgi:hypothetical protein
VQLARLGQGTDGVTAEAIAEHARTLADAPMIG